jgi:8-oxo-dGTP diphosphatase
VPRLKFALATFGLLREAARHLLRRPVVGIAVVATTPDGRYVLIRRGDTGQWALPGGTLEWGESLRDAAARELAEEAGVQVTALTHLCGVYSRPDRDPRFHAVTIVVRANVTHPSSAPAHPVEIHEVGLFEDASQPAELGMGMRDMLENARENLVVWE